MEAHKQTSKEARLKILDLIYKAQSSHVGSNFSCIDILTVLFSKIDLDKDKLILSKGWAVASVYYFLWKAGRITDEEIDSYCIGDSKFIGLTEPIIPDIPFAGGSMGLGFPASVGFAMAKKIKGEGGKVYCVMSDGEQAIGTTWEAGLIAAHHKLDNLIVIVDRNGHQAMNKTEDVLALGDLKDKWKSLGWFVNEIDGHDFEQIEERLKINYPGPQVIIANTIKGKGVSFMEDDNLWHYKSPNEDEYLLAKKELNG